MDYQHSIDLLKTSLHNFNTQLLVIGKNPKTDIRDRMIKTMNEIIEDHEQAIKLLESQTERENNEKN